MGLIEIEKYETFRNRNYGKTFLIKEYEKYLKKNEKNNEKSTTEEN